MAILWSSSRNVTAALVSINCIQEPLNLQLAIICPIYYIGSTSGSDTLQHKDILVFATGSDKIPPCGFHPAPSLLFYDGSLPLASTCSNELTIPTTHTSYYEFSRAFVEGVIGCGGLFGQP